MPEAGPGRRLADLVGLSLTGATVSLAGRADDARSIARALLDAGWSAERLLALRDAELAEGRPWPAFISAVDRENVGAAQLHFATQAVLEELGVGPQVRLRDHRQPLSPGDRALMAERPPHHGAVG